MPPCRCMIVVGAIRLSAPKPNLPFNARQHVDITSTTLSEENGLVTRLWCAPEHARCWVEVIRKPELGLNWGLVKMNQQPMQQEQGVRLLCLIDCCCLSVSPFTVA